MKWQTIDTAPKDRTIILAAHEFWQKVGIIEWVHSSGWCHYADGAKVLYPEKLTNWMPLPPPPGTPEPSPIIDDEYPEGVG